MLSLFVWLLTGWQIWLRYAVGTTAHLMIRLWMLFSPFHLEKRAVGKPPVCRTCWMLEWKKQTWKTPTVEALVAVLEIGANSTVSSEARIRTYCGFVLFLWCYRRPKQPNGLYMCWQRTAILVSWLVSFGGWVWWSIQHCSKGCSKVTTELEMTILTDPCGSLPRGWSLKLMLASHTPTSNCTVDGHVALWVM